MVGITSSDDKNTALIGRLGFDAAVNRRSSTFLDDLTRAVPSGIDVYFDNVAGPVTAGVLPRMNRHGRIVCSGATSAYQGGARGVTGFEDLALTAITRSLRLEGFLVGDFRAEWPEATSVLSAWRRSGRITSIETITTGLDSAPAALLELLDGQNLGQFGVALRA
ncbi:zinc-binding dehydrogenase [Curtobacterium sp. MCPF17_011]|uniref:zinc-binding dehydrogenase n=1 Tax=Curtobacterium sp. MCPF17_011 TaxID=2175652 RepID=UPI0015E8D954|nr:zinc-binding dehydrogenase [Curtobacterium sp. MCPF17_011]